MQATLGSWGATTVTVSILVLNLCPSHSRMHEESLGVRGISSLCDPANVP
jgi:hypothetical protein